ncbi:universal stress protein family domain-containing protein [Histoplasma capsulatum H143]|uniref:Universal stress protein family domain-containing protein n=1 Tax=Ajellomyces capsulatus (strain H143) TaxID=544712 RepID=C6HDT6_AJECH|nr:universal stress protein family domain-containing protein [Histoplasma capsulatum H143]
MSLESALDEERREIMDILEGRINRSQQSHSRARHSSPSRPIRSMLDVALDPALQKHNSAAGPGAGVDATSSSSRSVPPVRSLLDPISPSPLRLTHSAEPQPTQFEHAASSPPPPLSPLQPLSPKSPISSTRKELHARHSSDPAGHIGPLPEPTRRKQAIEKYQFEMLPSIPSQARPKRVSQGGKKTANHATNATHTNSMAAVMSGQELSSLPGFTRGRDTMRHGGTAGVSARHSKSPSSRLARSRSPSGGLLNTNSFNPKPVPGTFVTDTGKVIHLDHAYRQLSNAALSRSGGTLSKFQKSSTSRERGEDAVSESGDSRLQEDYYSGEETFSGENSSDEENDYSSSAEEDWSAEIQRGRRRSRKKSDSEENDLNKNGPQKVRSLLAAAEEERKKVSATYKVKSLLDPEPATGKAATEKPMIKKTGVVHPTTSFDHVGSGPNTPAGSDDEAQYRDFKKAQNLSIYMSPIDQSVPNRVIRTIVRGEFTRVQEEARQNRRMRLRTYLVATDLSDESVYALEWTIGTILRDGDTLYAVYAIDEETAGHGSGKGGEPDSTSSVQIGDGIKVMLDTAAVVGLQTKKTAENLTGASPLPSANTSSTQVSGGSGGGGGGGGGGGNGGTDSKTGSVDSRAVSKFEAERFRAIEGISQTVVRLLKKTRLQVRVAVEVIHCNSPKHLITEAIDGLEPTLVILGSRGRSALKGVLLGSFSNYLVTKSSVPVMVARKKLKKHTKFKRANVRLLNNLTTPKKLVYAKID